MKTHSRLLTQRALVNFQESSLFGEKLRQAAHLGLGVTVLEDATGTIDVSDDLPAALVHRVELGVLGDGFASVVPTAEWVAGLPA